MLGGLGLDEGGEGGVVASDGVDGEVKVLRGGAEGETLEEAEVGDAPARAGEEREEAERADEARIAEPPEDSADAAADGVGVFAAFAEGGDLSRGASVGEGGEEERAVFGCEVLGEAEEAVGVVGAAEAADVSGFGGVEGVEHGGPRRAVRGRANFVRVFYRAPELLQGICSGCSTFCAQKRRD